MRPIDADTDRGDECAARRRPRKAMTPVGLVIDAGGTEDVEEGVGLRGVHFLR